MRLFVTAWPAEAVRDALRALDRPDDPGLRWTTADQWHVTLAFLGEVDGGRVEDLVAAMAAAAASCPARAVVLGPATRRLGRGQLVVPAAGLDDLAAAVGAAALRALGRSPSPRPFRGHLTLARSRGGRPVPRSLEGVPVSAAWTVADVALVRSHLSDGPARYETLATAPLAPSLPS